jgi:hypothetical protein
MRDRWYKNSVQSPPPEVETYLITDDVGELQIAHWTDVSLFTGDSTGIWEWRGLKQYTYVVAWRLLPEAYVPVEKGDNNE